MTQWIAACQALFFTISWSLLKFMSTESVMISNHLVLCHHFSFCLRSFPASGSFPVCRFFAAGGQSSGASASALVLPMNIQGELYGWVIFHCIYEPQLLYPCICLWKSRLLSCPSYCNNAAMNTRYMYLHQLWSSQDTCPGVGLLDHMVVLFLVFFSFSFFKESPCRCP